MTTVQREALKRLTREPPLFNEPMKRHTTLRVGGPADALVTVQTKEELCLVVRFSRDHGLPLFILGEGSNLIVRDGGIRGLVLRLRGELARFQFNTGELHAGGGAYLPSLIVQAAQQGLKGLEFCTGVPGTVGGALISNAGTAEESIGELVERVTVVTGDGKIREVGRDELQFRYRESNVREIGLIVIGVTFRLTPDDPKAIMRRIRERWIYRRQTQPVHDPCAGCIFKNPPGQRAGRLLDLAGMKGKRVGDAYVSPIHANFIVNIGKATAKDVLTLTEMMRVAVLKKFGIQLDYEVQIVGEEI